MPPSRLAFSITVIASKACEPYLLVCCRHCHNTSDLYVSSCIARYCTASTIQSPDEEMSHHRTPCHGRVYDALPPESRVAHAQLLQPKDPSQRKACVLHLAGTGDHTWSRRMNLGGKLVQKVIYVSLTPVLDTAATCLIIVLLQQQCSEIQHSALECWCHEQHDAVLTCN